jgi:multiple sugar transport system substrate-binding protein
MVHRKSATIAAALALTTALAGCSGGNQANNESATKGAESNKEVVLRVWSADSTFEGESSPGQQIVKVFNEKNKGKIRVEAKYSPWESHNTAVQAAFASGDEPDLFQLPLGSQISDYVSKKLVQPISGLVSDQWSSKFYDGSFLEGINKFDGKIYSWPTTGPSLSYMLFYNKDVLKNAGLEPRAPKTWDELREMAKKVTAQGKGDVYGVAFGGGTPARFTQLVVAGFAVGASKGESPFDGFNFIEGKYDLGSKPWVDSVNFLLNIKKDGSILPSSFMLKTTEAEALFAEGKAAFLLNGRWGLSNVKKLNPNLNFGSAYTPTPDGSTPKYGYTLALPERSYVISKNSKHAAEVGKFIEEAIASKEFYNLYMKQGISLTPMPEVNADESNYPYPELKEFVKVHNDAWVLGPDPVARNPELVPVSTKIGGLVQDKMKPNTGEVLQMILNGKATNVEATLKEHSDKLNKNLEDAVNKAKADGAKVDMKDFQFSNWDGKSTYKEAK